MQPNNLCTAQPMFFVQSPILGLFTQAKASQVLFPMLNLVLKSLQMLAKGQSILSQKNSLYM